MDWLTIVLRIVHIGASVLWVGGAAFMFFFLQPTAAALGPQAGPFMAHLTARLRLPQVFGISAVLTILAGLLLYADASDGFDADWITSAVGVGFTVGGAAAIIAWVLGFVAIGPTAARLGEVSGAVASSGGPPSQEQAAELQALGRRARSLGWVNITLLLIAVVTMAAARYL
jgi:uncharacterized membrane protein